MRSTRSFAPLAALAVVASTFASATELQSASRSSPPRGGAAPAVPITVTDAKEHWLTIVIDPADHLTATAPIAPDMASAEPAGMRPTPTLAGNLICSQWIVWFPVSVQSPWSQIDDTATKVASVKRGKNGQIDAIPFQMVGPTPSVRQWHWGADTKGPEGASEWRMIVCGPPCDCCDPDCHAPTNPEVAQRGIGIELHARSAQPKVNWAACAALPWAQPGEKQLPFLTPAPYVESESPAVRSFVKHWLGNQPRAKSPWLTAVTLARGAAARGAPKTTSHSLRKESQRAKDPSMPPAAVRGLHVDGAAAFAQRGSGTAHDANCLAVAAMRSAGIPARVVLGFQIYSSPGFSQIAELTTWGEFWIGAIGWVPFDCGEMRTDSVGNTPADAPIDGFGEPSNHNMRIAWSWSFDAPFSRAAPRKYPAGFSLGPLYRTKEEAKKDYGAVKDEAWYGRLMAGQPTVADMLGSLGTMGATARSSRAAAAMWPDIR